MSSPTSDGVGQTATAATPTAAPAANGQPASEATAAAAAAGAGGAATKKKRGKGKKRRAGDAPLRNCISIALVCQSNLNRSMEAHWVLQERGHIRSYSFGAGSKVRLPGETIDRPHVYEFGTLYDTMYKDLERKNRARFTKNGMLQMLDRDRQLKEAPERWQDHYERYQNDAAAAAAKRRKVTAGSTASSPLSSSSSSDDPPKPRHFDLIITYEKRVYDIVQADVEARGSNPQLSANQPTHLLNIDTTDNHAEAAVSANLTLELVNAIYRHSKQPTNPAEEEEPGEDATAEEADAEENGNEEANDEQEDDDDDDGAEEEDWVDQIDQIIDEFEQKHGKEVGHTVLFY